MSSLYPQVDQSNPEAISYASSSSKSKSNPMYPSIEVKDLAENLFPDNPNQQSPPSSVAIEEVLVQIPGTIVHLIDEQQSVELASGDLTIVRLRQGENVVAVLARVGDEIQWPLAKDEAAVKLDESHYFFTLRVPSDARFDDDESGDPNLEADNILNYGVTIASKGQKGLLKEFDSVLEKYSAFSVEKVAGNVGGSVVARETSPEEMESGDKMALMEGGSAAYWTTLAPNVEDYSSSVAKMIATGSGHLIRGILWCGDVTVERLKWGDMFFRIRLASGSKTKISPEAMKRMKRVKKMTKMSEKVATGILSGVVKVSGFFTSSIVNSKVGNKFFSLLPGEIVLATLDGFNKVCDAVEVSGRSVMSTTSVVTTGLVSHRYGEEAAKVTNEGMDAAGHAIGTAWAVFKIRQAINPKSVIKPTSLVKAAARTKSDLKSKSKKK